MMHRGQNPIGNGGHPFSIADQGGRLVPWFPDDRPHGQPATRGLSKHPSLEYLRLTLCEPVVRASGLRDRFASPGLTDGVVGGRRGASTTAKVDASSEDS